ADGVALGARLRDGHEALPRPEQAGLDRQPLRLPGLLVEVDVADRTDLAAITIDQIATVPALKLVKVGHGSSRGRVAPGRVAVQEQLVLSETTTSHTRTVASQHASNEPASP